MAKIILFLEKIYNKKSCIQETLNLLTDADKSNDTKKKLMYHGRAVEVPLKCH